MDGGWEEAQSHPEPWVTWCKGGGCTAWIKTLWAVSCWLDVVTDVGRLWCAQAPKEVWTAQDCGSWFSWGARSVTHYVVSQKIYFGAWLPKSYPVSGFSSRDQAPPPCRLKKAPTLVLHNCLRLLQPGASRRARSYGVRTCCCQCWWNLDKWEHS